MRRQALWMSLRVAAICATRTTRAMVSYSLACLGFRLGLGSWLLQLVVLYGN